MSDLREKLHSKRQQMIRNEEADSVMETLIDDVCALRKKISALNKFKGEADRKHIIDGALTASDQRLRSLGVDV